MVDWKLLNHFKQISPLHYLFSMIGSKLLIFQHQIQKNKFSSFKVNVPQFGTHHRKKFVHSNCRANMQKLKIKRRFSIYSRFILRLVSQMSRLSTSDKWSVDLFEYI